MFESLIHLRCEFLDAPPRLGGIAGVIGFHQPERKSIAFGISGVRIEEDPDRVHHPLDPQTDQENQESLEPENGNGKFNMMPKGLGR